MLAQQPITGGEWLACTQWLPNQPVLGQHRPPRSCELWCVTGRKEFPTLDQAGGRLLANANMGLFAPVLHKQSSIGLSYYFSIIPRSRDFSSLLCSCFLIFAISLQICLSSAVVSSHSPLKGEETFPTGLFFHHEATLATSEQVWQINPSPLQLPSQYVGDNVKVSCMKTPFYFQLPKNFTRFPGSHPSKAQHEQEVGRKQRIEINFLKPALDLYFFQAGAVLDYKSIWRYLRNKVRWHLQRAGKAPQQIHTLSGFWLVGPWNDLPCPFQGLWKQIFALTLTN